MSELATVATETEILEQVIEPSGRGMSAEAAKALLGFRFKESAIARINDLAEKNRREQSCRPNASFWSVTSTSATSLI